MEFRSHAEIISEVVAGARGPIGRSCASTIAGQRVSFVERHSRRIKAPGQAFTYNGAQQLTSSTKDVVTTTYECAGADMNKVLSQSTDGGAEYDYTYGTTDRHGVPVITSRTVAGTGTASVISDPVTGQPLDLQTTDDTTSMWVVDGIGNPTAAITDAGEKAYEVHYDPYGSERITDEDKTSVQW